MDFYKAFSGTACFCQVPESHNFGLTGRKNTLLFDTGNGLMSE